MRILLLIGKEKVASHAVPKSVELYKEFPHKGRGLYAAFGIEHLMTDPRFQGYENLMKNRNEYVALAQASIKNFTSKEIMEKMRGARRFTARCQ